MNNIKLVGYVVIAVMILNLVMFAFGLVNVYLFWTIIICGAIFAWKVVPRMKK